MIRTRFAAAIVVAGAVSAACGSGSTTSPDRPPQSAAVPEYEVDPSWPPQLPNNWVIGVPTWVAVDSKDHVWVLHRPRAAAAEDRGRTAPPVIEFDPTGKFLQAWGGPGEGYDWPDTEHGIFVDQKDRVWITGINPSAGPDVSTRSDDMLLKFTKAGKFVQQIGGRDVSGGNVDTKNPKRAAEVFVDARTNEAFVADGYGNRRIWVIDAETGAFKRMWGAFGKTPLDPPALAPGTPDPAAAITEGPGPDQYGIVHGVKVSNDGFVYVADRGNRRIQVFSPDGKYLTQGFVNRTTSTASCDTVAFSPDRDQSLLYCPDFNRGEIIILNRKTLEPLSTFGSRGAGPGQMQNPHMVAVDSKGNVYAAEVAPGRRLQKFAIKTKSVAVGPDVRRQ